MNYLLPNPTGEDFFVQGLQMGLYKRLCGTWGVDDSSYSSFGRVQRTKASKGYIPEFYDPDTQQYVSGNGDNTRGGLFFDDRLAAISFMGVADPERDDRGICTVKARIIFFVNLGKITPGGLTTQQQAGQRLDEVAINDVRNYIQANGYNFTVQSMHRNIDKALEWYSGTLKEKALMDNMNEKLCFAIELELRYNPLLNRGAIKQQQLMPTLIPQSLKLYIVDSPDPNSKIQVGLNKWIQKEYAPGNTLTPMATSDGNGFLAGRKVLYPFTYDNGVIQADEGYDQYSEVTGIWDRTPQGGFLAWDKVTITVLVNQFN